MLSCVVGICVSECVFCVDLCIWLCVISTCSCSCVWMCILVWMWVIASVYFSVFVCDCKRVFSCVFNCVRVCSYKRCIHVASPLPWEASITRNQSRVFYNTLHKYHISLDWNKITNAYNNHIKTKEKNNTWRV